MVSVLKLDKDGWLYVIPKSEWSAMEPTSVVPRTMVFKRVSFTYTNTRSCRNRADCVELLRNMQVQDIENGCSDIKPNFLIGGYGAVYEGRGWDILGDLAENYSPSTLEIAYIGTKDYSYDMVSSGLSLVKFALQRGFIIPGFNISFHTPANKNFIRLKNSRPIDRPMAFHSKEGDPNFEDY